ncbi:MAG: cysteine desulfurase [Erysipelotrichaceae bacterium]|nr:cysteine desulfurase [Erysipelotrichaceae bacterium]
MRRVQHNRVYLDYASTTPVHPEILKAYKGLLDVWFVNSESLYQEGAQLHQLMEKSRAQTASLLNVRPNEIIFTSGASEASSMAIKGVAFRHLEKKGHLITTQVEHSSVTNCFKQLEELGFEVTWLSVDKRGCISMDELKKSVRHDTLLVSIMMVNNEVGAINPINEIKAYLKNHSHALLHVDCVQALGKIPVDLKDIDMASFSAHKIHGLKGSGVLFCRQHIDLMPLVCGGQQEFGRRGGTENALVNLMFAKTLRLALEGQKNGYEHAKMLNEYCIEQLSKMPEIELNSSSEGLPHILNFSCSTMLSEVLMNALNTRGFCVSAQSTCHSKSKAPSFVLKAMGYSDQRALSSIRLSFSYETTLKDVESFIHTLKECTQKYGTRL